MSLRKVEDCVIKERWKTVLFKKDVRLCPLRKNLLAWCHLRNVEDCVI